MTTLQPGWIYNEHEGHYHYFPASSIKSICMCRARTEDGEVLTGLTGEQLGKACRVCARELSDRETRSRAACIRRTTGGKQQTLWGARP